MTTALVLALVILNVLAVGAYVRSLLALRRAAAGHAEAADPLGPPAAAVREPAGV